MKKIFLLTLLVCICNICFCQTWNHNLEKYWWYRYRLVNDFTYIEPNPAKAL